ncbi:hypothetical protein TWF106_007669 [Orbilia oligospora]|uniref:Uncharacterized protein n=1 Tax=Orbilia oligospora TaxID=2813651 RepID=A0A7C8UJW9_ORBOL|nr:hypothetical protein TWF106_007669 [Orbilia oligospora]
MCLRVHTTSSSPETCDCAAASHSSKASNIGAAGGVGRWHSASTSPQYRLSSEVMADFQSINLRYLTPTMLEIFDEDLILVDPEARRCTMSVLDNLVKLREDALPAYRMARRRVEQASLFLKEAFLGKSDDDENIDPPFQRAANKLKKFFISSPTKKAVKYVIEHQKYQYNARHHMMTNPIHGMVNLLERYLIIIDSGKEFLKKFEWAMEAKNNVKVILFKTSFMLKQGLRVLDCHQKLLKADFTESEESYIEMLGTCQLVEKYIWFNDFYMPLMETFGQKSVSPIITLFNDLFKDLWHSETNPSGPQKLEPLGPECFLWDIDFDSTLGSIHEICRLIKIDPKKKYKTGKRRQMDGPESSLSQMQDEANLSSPEAISSKKRKKKWDSSDANPAKKKKEITLFKLDEDSEVSQSEEEIPEDIDPFRLFFRSFRSQRDAYKVEPNDINTGFA